ncbi:HgcAB-associated protein [Desulfobacterales bacterium HSG2]|nr:HgcAB-associated protein [Desulfobacterales bacterium HSG2]
MAESKNKKETVSSCDVGCCKIEAMVSVDARGQIVLPKEVRKKAGISAGDKLAVVSWERDGEVCCISLQKADDFGEMVKERLGPVMKDILK